MITLLPNIRPIEITLVEYTPSVIVEWLHGGKRQANTAEQRRTQTGPTNVIPTAIFTIGENALYWEESTW